MSWSNGYPFYGQNVGVLVFSTTTPRTPGDAGHAASFSYPVCYEVVTGGFSDLIEGNKTIRTHLIEAALHLKGIGVKTILGDCGLMSLYQTELGQRSGLPTAASSLCLIPTIWQMIGRSGTIGIITGHSELLGEAHLRSSGWTPDIALSIQGMQNEPHFRKIVIEGGYTLNTDKMRQDILHAGGVLREKTPDLRAVIFECSNLATYSADLANYLNLPVFDTIAAANLLQYGISPPHYL